MATRSVQFTLVNNWILPLTQYQNNICHGFFATNPPETINPSTTGEWLAQDDSPSFEGTEGWVKYTCPQTGGQNPTDELVFIYWDLPYFIFDGSGSEMGPSFPYDFKTTVSDVDINPGSNGGFYCDTGGALAWPGTLDNIVAGTETVTTLSIITTPGTNPPTYNPESDIASPTHGVITVMVDLAVVWPAVYELFTLTDDINLSFTLTLSQKSSVGQKMRHVYDGRNGLRALAVAAHQPSLRKVFGI